MAKQAKTENMPVVTKSYGFTECKPVNTIIDRGYIDTRSGNFIIKELDVEISKEKLTDFIQHALTRALTQDTSGMVSVETIDAEIAVWQAGYPCLPAWRRAQRETSKLVQSVTGKKSGYLYASRRLILEGWLVDRKGIDFARSFQALSDPEFEAWMKSDKKIPQWLRSKLEAYDAEQAAKLLDLEAKVQAKVETLPDDDFDDEIEESKQEMELQAPAKPKNGKGK